MSADESKSEPSDIRESKAEESPLPAAWQPLTPRGVAAFSRATLGRLMLVQAFVAALVTASVLWFLATTWFPTTRAAIRQLPETGQIQNQELTSPRTSTAPLAETRLLSFVMDLENVGTPNLPTDLRVIFHRQHVALCGMLGCVNVAYPKDRLIPFSQLELESAWGAWAPFIYTVTGLAAMLWLFASWMLLATLYSPIVRIYAFFKDRQITVAGSWRLSAAALLPAALMTGGGIVLYGLGVIDLIGFLVLFALHFPVGWAYLFVSPLRLPRASDAVELPKQNPFTPPIGSSESESEPAPKPANPFAGSTRDATEQPPNPDDHR